MIQVTDETFVQEVLQSPIPVLVDFYANWCGPCKAAAPSIETLAKEFEGKVKVCKLDIDTGSKYAVEQGLKGIPAFILFAHGSVVQMFVGWHDLLEQTLREALTAAASAT